MLGILQGLVPNQGSGWDHALRELKGFYESIGGRTGSTGLRSFEGRPLLELAGLDIPAEAREAIGRYLQDGATLGRRTAELHLALASDPADPAFAPEPITTSDLEHMAGEIREQVEKALYILESRLESLHEATRDQASRVLGRSTTLLESLKAWGRCSGPATTS
jgi:maltose alpha-D-glucosyltransferase/alpha-amylase